jgi:hypothetical protein
MVLRTVRREAGLHERKLKALKTKLTQLGISGSRPIRSIGSRDGQTGGWALLMVPKALKEESGNNSRKPRDLAKNWHSDSLKKSQLTLSQRKSKKGDVVVVADDDDDDDDEVRTSVSLNPVTVPLCTEELFLRT